MCSPNAAGFELTNGIIKFKGRVWVGNNTLAQNHILQALHDSAIGGHSGFPATYHRVKQLFAWPKMKQFIRDYVRSCTTCQQAKPEHVKSPDLLQPLPIPDQAWSIVCMDFVEGLPSSRGYTVIMVIVDKLSKYAHFLPLAPPFTALQVAQYTLIRSIGSMGFQRLLFLTEIRFSPALFGRPCSSSLTQPC